MTGALPERLRLRYSKLGRLRFTSQRDVARMLERGLRRAALPLARTGGFTPRPKLSFGLALPTGCASLAEFVDLRLERGVHGCLEVVEGTGDAAALGALPATLSGLLPVGLDVTAAGALLGPEPSLQEAVASCDWEVEVLGVSPAVLAGRVERLLAADSVPIARTRKGREVADDLRPGVLELVAVPEPGPRGTTLATARLATRPRGIRPGELCAALGPDVELVGACRTHQWMETDGRTPVEPLSVAAHPGGPPACAEVRGG